MQKKSVLLITPFFAPQSHAAVFRVHKLAKYLPRFGWKPYVLTVDKNYNFNEDSTLSTELPKEVEIYKSLYVEPTLRGLRMLLGGKNRSFVQEKSQGRAIASVAVKKTKGSNSRILYQKLVDNFLFSPDQFWPWYYSAVRVAKKIITEKQIPIIYTTCLPYTSLRIGKELKSLNVKWVADFRDPGTYAASTSSHLNKVLENQKRHEAMAFKYADVFSGLSSSYTQIFSKTQGVDTTQFIPTGVDDDLVPKLSDSEIQKSNYILFVGEMLKDYKDHFLRIYAEAKKSGKSDFPKMKIIGNLQINKSVVGEYVSSLGLSDSVEFLDHMPQRELYKFIIKARGCVLIPGHSAFWWTNFAKLVDYVGLRVPVIALVPDPSEARSVLKSAGLGIFLDGDFKSQVQTLSEFLSEKISAQRVNVDFCRQYLASTMTEKFVDIFEHLVRSPG